jgi:hypothetical protein
MYNVRDLLGHWVKPRSRRGKMCPHACCRNKRVHPANFPVILPSALLRRASDDDLAEQYRRHGGDARARAQVEREMNRRDQRDRRRVAVAGRAAERRTDRQVARHARFLAAERATNGNMVNKKGRARGISDERVLFGPPSVARRYGSDELLAYRGLY